MNTQQIADRLVELCRKGEFTTAQKELYAENATSTEPYATPEFEKETKGLAALLEKNKKFESLTEEIYSIAISEPLIASNAFTFSMNMDMAMKGKGRMQMAELCVYEVKDGKIVSETFYV